jgi:hypothetical protein
MYTSNEAEHLVLSSNSLAIHHHLLLVSMGKEESKHIYQQSPFLLPSTQVESTLCNLMFPSLSSFPPNKSAARTNPAVAYNLMISPSASVRVIFIYIGIA